MPPAFGIEIRLLRLVTQAKLNHGTGDGGYGQMIDADFTDDAVEQVARGARETPRGENESKIHRHSQTPKTLIRTGSAG